MNAFLLLVTIGIALAADSNPFPTSINGNIGLVGSGYGDVYAGKIKEGVYGAGGRVGGNIGLVGSAGLGRKKRALTSSSATAGAIASGPDAFSMAGAAAGSASLGFGSPARATPASTPAAPAATTAAAPTPKPCGKRRRRSAQAPVIGRNETGTKVIPSIYPSIYPLPVYPMVFVPSVGVPVPPIPEGTHGLSTWGAFKFSGTATVDNNGQIKISGIPIVDGDTTFF